MTKNHSVCLLLRLLLRYTERLHVVVACMTYAYYLNLSFYTDHAIGTSKSEY
jgi:hypothetical protein